MTTLRRSWQLFKRRELRSASKQQRALDGRRTTDELGDAAGAAPVLWGYTEGGGRVERFKGETDERGDATGVAPIIRGYDLGNERETAVTSLSVERGPGESAGFSSREESPRVFLW